MDSWLTDVKNKFIESANHYKNNREYNILSNKYGKPLNTTPKICYKENEIFNVISTIVENVISFYLPKRNIKEDSTLSFEQQKTIDKVDEILQTVTSNEQFETTKPRNTVVGCKDPKALNYNPNADVGDITLCVYPVVDKPEPAVVVKPKPKPKPIDKPKPIPIDLYVPLRPQTPSPYSTPEEIGNQLNQPLSYLQAAINPFNQGMFSQPIVMNRGVGSGVVTSGRSLNTVSNFDTSSFQRGNMSNAINRGDIY